MGIDTLKQKKSRSFCGFCKFYEATNEDAKKKLRVRIDMTRKLT